MPDKNKNPVMPKKADLHIHTIYSDGTFSPRDAVESARLKGLSAVAITDHDITDGIEEALKAGAKIGIEVIPGIELSCDYNGCEVHILGFYINWENRHFQDKLKIFQKARERRAVHILSKLKMVGIKMDEQMLFSQANIGSISRIHFARVLIKMGEAKDIKDAFQKYLVEGKPAFVRKLRITPEDALSMIHRVGGISVVAHPVFGGGRKSFLKKLKRLGLAGVEAYHPGQPPQITKKILKFADELNLIITGGSDSHGEEKSEDPIGSVKIDYSFVDKLKAEKNNRDNKNRFIF